LNTINEEHETYQWKAHPARQRGRMCCIAIAILLAVAAAVFLSFGALWSGFSLLILVVALNRFFLPSTFVIDAQGITARYPLRHQRLNWNELRRFVLDRNGGYLSRRSRPSRLDAHAGMHVLFGSDRSRAIEQIRRHMRRALILPEIATVDEASEVAGAGRCRA